jgi:hypothetical protein
MGPELSPGFALSPRVVEEIEEALKPQRKRRPPPEGRNDNQFNSWRDSVYREAHNRKPGAAARAKSSRWRRYRRRWNRITRSMTEGRATALGLSYSTLT